MSLIQKKLNAKKNDSEKAPKKDAKQTGKTLQDKTEALDKMTEKWDTPSVTHVMEDVPYSEEEIVLASIIPDKSNARTRFILPGNPTKNNLNESHPFYAENQSTIDGLIEFSEHFKTTPLRQSIEVYKQNGKYHIISGNRRYYAYFIGFGSNHKIKAKVYLRKPAKFKCERFIENEQREQLSPSSKIIDFEAAYRELESDKSIAKSDYLKILGKTKTVFYDCKKIIDNNVVFNALVNGDILTFEQCMELLRKLKSDDDIKSVISIFKKGKISISEAIEKLSDIKSKQGLDKPKKKTSGRRKTSIKLPRLSGETAGVTIKAIIEGKLKDMDWSEVDWSDLESIEKAFSENIDKLSGNL